MEDSHSNRTEQPTTLIRRRPSPETIRSSKSHQGVLFIGIWCGNRIVLIKIEKLREGGERSPAGLFFISRTRGFLVDRPNRYWSKAPKPRQGFGSYWGKMWCRNHCLCTPETIVSTHSPHTFPPHVSPMFCRRILEKK